MAGPAPWIVGAADGEVRKHAPATLRNRDPIARVLAEILPRTGRVVEVASGSGEHCAFFARAFPALCWQPSDPDPGALASIESWCADIDHVAPPLRLDASEGHWPVARADAVLAINMAHIAPWEATLGLMRGAGRLLPAGGPLYLYGPFAREGEAMAQSNRTFDQSLRARDPRWGIRPLESVEAAAADAGLTLDRVIDMPANNLSVVFRRA